MHVSLRRCLVCRSSAEKHALLRVALSPAGGLMFDEGQSLGGRGAYVHAAQKCLSGCLDAGKLAQALRVEKSAIDVVAWRKFVTERLGRLAGE